ncbi:hypothetical protein [Rufibacter roseus]|uniref:Secreted protein n=1 Tax=Rufibacter roseus TaxID=1567108 RepID=A0ABW2DI62_9BACT|nr:hypothetical protein [Rufibacter roseus]
MKKLSNVAAAALVAVSFGFASCDSKTANNMETETENTIDDISAEADSLSLDSIEVRDQPVNDGVADKMENNQ